jgi:hypothetical protein
MAVPRTVWNKFPCCRARQYSFPRGLRTQSDPAWCEIQQNSDLTYRVYDYYRRDSKGQPRPLHIEKALDVIRFGKQISGKIVPIRIRRGNVRETQYAVCRYFATERSTLDDAVETSPANEYSELLVSFRAVAKYGAATSACDEVCTCPRLADSCSTWTAQLGSIMLRHHSCGPTCPMFREFCDLAAARNLSAIRGFWGGVRPPSWLSVSHFGEFE